MEMNDMMDDSLDGGPPSVGSGEMMGTTMSMGITTAPVSAKKVCLVKINCMEVDRIWQWSKKC